MKMLMLIFTVISLNFSFAEEAVNHEAHPGMKMDMSEMKDMMGQCMEKNKDNKMCNQEMMKSCMDKMGKNDCAKMMKKMKGHKMNMGKHDMDSMKK